MLYKWSPSLLSYLNHSAIFTRECDFNYIWADFHLKNENIHWMIVSYVMLVWFPSRIVYIFSQFFLIFQGEKETVVFKVDKYGNKDIHIPCLRKYRQSEYRKLLKTDVYSTVLHPTFPSCVTHMSIDGVSTIFMARYKIVM